MLLTSRMSLISILHNQGKINLMKKIKSNDIDINDLIMTEHYYFTNLDICLLVNLVVLLSLDHH